MEETVTVRDPTHPLFGQSFRVAYREHGSTRSTSAVFVWFDGDDRVRLAALALVEPRRELPPTRISLESIAAVVAVASGLGVGLTEDRGRRKAGAPENGAPSAVPPHPPDPNEPHDAALVIADQPGRALGGAPAQRARRRRRGAGPGSTRGDR